MSGKIVGEVLDYAPEALSESERWVLVAIAEAARDTDRVARYEVDVPTLARRSQRSPGTVRNCLSTLTAKGLIKPLLAARRGLVQHYQIARLASHHRFITYTDAGSTHRADKRRKSVTSGDDTNDPEKVSPPGMTQTTP